MKIGIVGDIDQDGQNVWTRADGEFRSLASTANLTLNDMRRIGSQSEGATKWHYVSVTWDAGASLPCGRKNSESVIESLDTKTQKPKEPVSLLLLQLH